ncbi:YrhK family protein [Marinobacter fonticola]|uniref:YrhK family protein n=1 Tax=Marinobacter fonticola TaxID=2603215 RepID=UPI0011E71558|nr:YrhK family protein [Marinobacter fonticola]
MKQEDTTDNPLTLTIGHEQLVIRRRYEILSILNDFMIAIWFFVGSVLFLYPSLETAAIWLFIIGSFQFLIRPTIRLLAHFHVQRVPESHWDG